VSGHARGDAESPLSEAAEELYLELLSGRPRLRHDDPRVRELVENGWAACDDVDASLYVALEPCAPAMSATDRELEHIRKALARIESARETGERLYSAYRAKAPNAFSSDIEKFSDPEHVRRRIWELASKSRTEMLSIQPDEVARPERVLKLSLEQEVPRIRAGVSVRTLYHPIQRAHAATRDYVAALTREGGQARTIRGQAPMLIIIDRKQAIFRDPMRPLRSDGRAGGAVIVHDPSLVAHLVMRFEAIWRASLPFTGDGPTGAPVLTSLQWGILQDMADGVSQEESARRFGVSKRTLQIHLQKVRRIARPADGRISDMALGVWFAKLQLLETDQVFE
jgi:hypothetical protein